MYEHELVRCSGLVA